MKISPRTRLKVYQIGEKINIALAVLNVGTVVLLMLTEQPVPTEGFIAIALNIVCLLLCANGISMVKRTHGLDDSGNFSWKDKSGDANGP